MTDSSEASTVVVASDSDREESEQEFCDSIDDSKGTTSPQRERMKDASVPVSAVLCANWPVTNRYTVLMADIPWTTSQRKSKDRKKQITVKEAHSLGPLVRLITDDPGFLFLWSSAGELEKNMATAKQWGFEFKTCFVWYRHQQNHPELPRLDSGVYHQGSGDFILMFTRKSRKRHFHKIAWMRHKIGNVLLSDMIGNGRNPASWMQFLADYIPTVERIELFARRGIVGWDAWGPDVPNGFLKAEEVKALCASKTSSGESKDDVHLFPSQKSAAAAACSVSDDPGDARDVSNLEAAEETSNATIDGRPRKRRHISNVESDDVAKQ